MHCDRWSALFIREPKGNSKPGKMIPIKMMRTADFIASFKILVRLRHKAVIDRTAAKYNPHVPNNASDAASMKKIKNSVDKRYCMG
jgi:hypothetical protein